MRLMLRPADAKRAAQEHAKTNEAAKPFVSADLKSCLRYGCRYMGAFVWTVRLKIFICQYRHRPECVRVVPLRCTGLVSAVFGCQPRRQVVLCSVVTPLEKVRLVHCQFIVS